MFRLLRAIIRLTNTVQDEESTTVSWTIHRGTINRQSHTMKYKLLLFIKNNCKPDDGSHEPKHVAPCSPLFLINNSNFYFIVRD